MNEVAMREDLIQCPVHGPVAPNTHHIVPGSRGGKNKGNVNKNTCPFCHEYYHWLFSNLTPDEIIAYLVKNFWGGQVEWVYAFLEEYEEERGDGWPESEANWTPHTKEAKLRQFLEGHRRLHKRYRELGLNTADYVVFDERSTEIVAFVQRGAGQGREDLETLLGRKLKWYESIRPVVINISLPDQ